MQRSKSASHTPRVKCHRARQYIPRDTRANPASKTEKPYPTPGSLGYGGRPGIPLRAGRSARATGTSIPTHRWYPSGRRIQRRCNDTNLPGHDHTAASGRPRRSPNTRPHTARAHSWRSGNSHKHPGHDTQASSDQRPSPSNTEQRTPAARGHAMMCGRHAIMCGNTPRGADNTDGAIPWGGTPFEANYCPRNSPNVPGSIVG